MCEKCANQFKLDRTGSKSRGAILPGEASKTAPHQTRSNYFKKPLLFPGKTERIHWSFDDPAKAEGDEKAVLAIFRRVRDEIEARLREFIN